MNMLKKRANLELEDMKTHRSRERCVGRILAYIIVYENLCVIEMEVSVS